MKAYITKYALTKGIIETDGEISETTPTMLIVKGRSNFDDYFHGNQWTTSLEVARGTARAMRRKKIDSLTRQIAKLQAMEF